MFTLSPATTHSSLAVSPSGTITVEGSSVMVSSPSRPKEGSTVGHSSVLPHLCHLTSEVTSPTHPSQDRHLTQNSELDPSLVSVLPTESNTGVEATVFHSNMADDQRAIGLQLVSRDKEQSGGSIPGGWQGLPLPGEGLSGPYCSVGSEQRAI